jgi:hypothetical protein
MPIINRVADFEEGQTFIIENVFVDFASVFHPNTKYRPEWACVIRVPQVMIQNFYEVGFRLKQNPDGVVTLRAKRYVRLDDGSEMQPPTIVDCDNNPWTEQRGLIGNGSRCNVKVRAKYTTYQGVEGLSCFLEGLQILDHVPYYGSGPQFAASQGTTGGFEGGFAQPAPPQPPVASQNQHGFQVPQPEPAYDPTPYNQQVPGQYQQPPPQPPQQAVGQNFVPPGQPAVPPQQYQLPPQPPAQQYQEFVPPGHQGAPSAQVPAYNPAVPQHMQQPAAQPQGVPYGQPPAAVGQQIPTGPPQGGNVSQPVPQQAVGGGYQPDFSQPPQQYQQVPPAAAPPAANNAYQVPPVYQDQQEGQSYQPPVYPQDSGTGDDVPF